MPVKCIVCLLLTQVDRDIITTDRCFRAKVDYHLSLYDGIQLLTRPVGGEL
jgi:hypothetical protein